MPRSRRPSRRRPPTRHTSNAASISESRNRTDRWPPAPIGLREQPESRQVTRLKPIEDRAGSQAEQVAHLSGGQQAVVHKRPRVPWKA